jgi:L-threonylcarbamoyladenylate synthase
LDRELQIADCLSSKLQSAINYGIWPKKKPIITDMKRTEVISVHPEQPEPELIGRAAAVLRQGGLVAFPTETVYGLGADALREKAVQEIFAAKGRPAANPLIVHVPDATAARLLAGDWPEAAERLAEQFWPGSLTLVVPRCAAIPAVVMAGGSTVGLRVPAHPVALALLVAAGLPVAAPSANRSNRLSPTRAEHVAQDLNGRIDLILDGGPAWGGLESTVVDVTTSPPRVLRPGPVTPSQLEAVIGPVVRPTLVPGSDAEPLRSPGLLGRHYAPRAPLECVRGSGRNRAAELAGQGWRVGWLSLGADPGEPAGVQRQVMPEEADAYAALLYAALHQLDASGVERIVADLPQDTDEWLAIRDRLLRMTR